MSLLSRSAIVQAFEALARELGETVATHKREILVAGGQGSPLEGSWNAGRSMGSH